jgi:hypothetical protein
LNNRELETGAKAIAQDLKLPGGRQAKLARVVEKHLGWFELAEARGLTWDDMIAALAAAGVRGDDGLPLKRGTLSSTVWRKRNQGRAKPPTGGEEAAAPRQFKPAKKSASSPPAAGRSNAARGVPPVASSQAGVLAFMQRAARMRRGDDHD